eukprot:gene4449-4705_t
MKIVDATTNQTANQCQLMLVAKDGVYLMQIPRKIEAMLLPPGGRSEVLVRCSAPVGSKFYLWAGDAAPFSSNEFGDKAQPNLDRVFRHLYFKQDVLATIIILPATPSSGIDPVLQANITERKCTPRRPPYAADMRDESLAANNYNTSEIASFTSGFKGQLLPKWLNASVGPSDLFLWGCGILKEDGQYHTFSLPDEMPWVMELGKIVQIDFKDFEMQQLSG